MNAGLRHVIRRHKKTPHFITRFALKKHCMCLTAMLRLPHMRLSIVLNLEGKQCVRNNQCTVGPRAMASSMCIHEPTGTTMTDVVKVGGTLCLNKARGR